MEETELDQIIAIVGDTDISESDKKTQLNNITTKNKDIYINLVTKYFELTNNKEIEIEVKQKELCLLIHKFPEETKKYFIDGLPRNIYLLIFKDNVPFYTSEGKKTPFPPSAVDKLYELILEKMPKLDVNNNEIDYWNKFTLPENYHDIIVKPGDDLEKVRVLSNLIPGPKILKSEGRGYGLFADKTYKKIEIIYGGLISEEGENFTGNYVVSNPMYDVDIDSQFWFKLKEKGRWINDDEPYNVLVTGYPDDKKIIIGNDKVVTKNTEFLLDYGECYDKYWKKEAKESDPKKVKCLNCSDIKGKLYYDSSNPEWIFCGVSCQLEHYKLNFVFY